MVTITFDGKQCQRILARKLSDGSVVADTNLWASDYKIICTQNTNSLSIQRYGLDAQNNILLTKEHLVISYDRVLLITVDY